MLEVGLGEHGRKGIEKMIQKILIANRGEIAVRIIRTCQKMNIKTVAVYSEADEKSLFGKLAAESYLKADKIVDIAKKTAVDAIHPGYGFLSENAEFVYQCEDAGIIFIGPKAEVMQQMGDKIKARQIMEKAGVPVTPGTSEAVAEDTAKQAASSIGYPLMLKEIGRAHV